MYNIETNKYINKLFIDGNAPIENNLMLNNILLQYDILYFNKNFNQKLDNLTSNIKAIRFANYNTNNNFINYNTNNYYINIVNLHCNESFLFNQPIINLPPDLELLELSGVFEQSLAFLPLKLKCLILNIYNFARVCLDLLPIYLEILILKSNSYSFTALPYGLRELYLIGHNSGLICNLPPNLYLLFINGNLNYLDIYFTLPDNLEVFIFNDNEYLEINYKIIKTKLKNKEFPKTLKEIQFPTWYCKYNSELINLTSYIDNVIIIYKYINDDILNNILHKY